MKQKLNLIAPYLLPRLQDLLFIGIFLFVCSQGFRLLNGDGDLGRHITLGNYILDHWVVPTHDIFSNTMAGKDLVPHEWLAEVFFALATRMLGLSGDVIIAGIVIATAFVITYKQTVNRGVSRLFALLIVAWAVIASFLHWQVRPHIFTFLFVAIWTFILEQVVDKKKIGIWVLPLIMLIWANVHGGFFLGFVILGAYFAGWAWEYWQGLASKETGIYLVTAGFWSFVVSFINPAGWNLWITSTGLIGKRFIIDNTSEYLSPNFHIISTWPFLIMVILSILLLGTSNQLRKHEIFLFAGWTALSLYMARNIPLYAIVAAPYFGILIQPALDRSVRLRQLNNVLSNMEVQLKGFVYPILTVLLVTYLFFSGVRMDPLQMGNQHDPAKFPVDAASWLKENPQSGNMFNEFTWGGYLLYRLWPGQTVFIDGTTDFFGDAFTREYSEVTSLDEGWHDTLVKYHVAWAIMPSDSELIKTLKNEYGWQVIYQDRTATIVRNIE